MSPLLRRPLLAVASLVVVLAGGVASAANAAPDSAAYCGITWGSQAKAAGQAATAPFSTVRTGRHACFDRVVFEFDGSADGYGVEYVSAIRTDGEGRLLTVAGGAQLQVRLLATVFDDLGHLHYAGAVGAHVASVGGYSTLRDVVYAGCFEGQTTLGVGVRARLPFRVFTLAGPGSHSRIVLDIAHRW